MNMKHYGDRMLGKQLKLAEKKGNKEYAEQLKEELMARGVMKRPPAKMPMVEKKEVKRPPAQRNEKK